MARSASVRCIEGLGRIGRKPGIRPLILRGLEDPDFGTGLTAYSEQWEIEADGGFVIKEPSAIDGEYFISQ